MWWSKRGFLLGGLALAGCGFTPAYGPQGGASRLAGNVAVRTPETRDGFLILQRLENRLGRNDAGSFALEVTLRVDSQGLATDSDGRTNRFRLVGQATYALKDQNGRVLNDGKVTHFTGYSATGSTVATLAAEQDAKRRLMIILADQIVDRLVIAAADLPV